MPYKNKDDEARYKKDYYRDNKKRISAITHNWYIKNKERKKETEKIWRKNNPEKCKQYVKNWLANGNESYFRDANKKIYTENRKKVLAHYGNKCECCGESRTEFMAIDHVNNDGNVERKTKLKSTHGLLGYIVKNNYPPQYRLLCHNCNMSRGLYGYCPHKREKI